MNIKKYYNIAKTKLFPITRSLTGEGVRETLKVISKKLPSIRTERLRIRQLSELNSEEFNLKEEQGITKRINKI